MTQAGESGPSDTGTPPLIALALGGGAALGWAHIGALRALDEAGLKVGAVAGTSIGALVGACYLAGKLDRLEEIARAITWRRMVRYADPQFGGPGLIKGDAIIADLLSNVGPIHIEDLSAPFTAVAADLLSGQEIWLRSGALGPAIRASISIPGVFLPVEHGLSLLVDGGLVNPVPVSAARALGGDVVIAVDVAGDYLGRAEAAGLHQGMLSAARPAPEPVPDTWSGRLKGFAGAMFDRSRRRPGLYSVGMTSAALMMRELARAKMALMPPDAIVRPHVGRFAPMEFDKADALIAAGYEAMQAALPELRHQIERKRRPAAISSA